VFGYQVHTDWQGLTPHMLIYGVVGPLSASCLFPSSQEKKFRLLSNLYIIHALPLPLRFTTTLAVLATAELACCP